VVRRLFEPLGLDRDAVPTDLVTGAAALATRAFRPDAGLAGDPFATVHGLYWLTVNLSGRAPVLLTVDDCRTPPLGWSARPSAAGPATGSATSATGPPAATRCC
jgi:hypothetical protein